MPAPTSDCVSSQSAILQCTESSSDLIKKVNESPFTFQHGLASHPLFDVERLIRLSDDCGQRPGDLGFDAGDVRVEQKWGSVPAPAGMTAHDAIRNMETSGAWVIMKHVEQDPEYRQILNRCSEVIFDWAAEPLRKVLKNPEMLVIMNSPNRITPFHMDRELNFLLQIRGHKTIRIFDRNDRVVITEEEFERLYSNDLCAATYKPNIDERAHLFELSPSMGVHIPITFPHWVKNGSDVSISISINFEVPDSLRADLYRVNHVLRRAGVRPLPPGRSPWKDQLKRQVAAGFWKAYPLARRLIRPRD